MIIAIMISHVSLCLSLDLCISHIDLFFSTSLSLFHLTGFEASGDSRVQPQPKIHVRSCEAEIFFSFLFWRCTQQALCERGTRPATQTMHKGYCFKHYKYPITDIYSDMVPSLMLLRQQFVYEPNRTEPIRQSPRQTSLPIDSFQTQPNLV